MNSWDFSMHQEGTSVCAAGSSASTATTPPTGTSLIRSASMMIGIGHLRPRASIVSAGVGAAGVPLPAGAAARGGAPAAAGGPWGGTGDAPAGAGAYRPAAADEPA